MHVNISSFCMCITHLCTSLCAKANNNEKYRTLKQGFSLCRAKKCRKKTFESISMEERWASSIFLAAT